MWYYQIKLAFRNFLRNRIYTFINVFGLSIGITVTLLLLLWTFDELGKNQFHANLDQIHLVRTRQFYGSNMEYGSGTPPALSPALKNEYPEVINSGRIQNGNRPMLFQYGEKSIYQRLQLADPSIFDIFSFPLSSGSLTEAAENDKVLVLSESVSLKFFGEGNPIGKVIYINEQYEFKVIAVMKEMTEKSTIRFGAWAPLTNLRTFQDENYIDTWFNLSFRTYALLQPGTVVKTFNAKIKNRIREGNEDCTYEPFVYPFQDMYLHLWNNIKYIKIFMVTAILILLIACINFINLSTAHATKRAKLVGLQKVVGAQRDQLIRQFFTESLILTTFSLILAIILVEVSMPFFNDLTGKTIDFNYLQNSPLLIGVLLITIFSGLLSGLYPAVVLSSFNPVKALKGKSKETKSSPGVRKVLVVVQFSISIFLIISTMIIYKQVSYLKNMDLGLNKEQVLYVNLQGKIGESTQAYKNELVQNPGIQYVSFATGSPTGIYWNGEGWDWEGRDPNLDPLITYLSVDEDYANMFELEVTKGDFLKPTNGAPNFNVVINEEMVRIMGKENPVGEWLAFPEMGIRLTIIGVIKDFHFTSLTQSIRPLLIFNAPAIEPYDYAFIRLDTENIQESISHIESITKTFNPEYPFEYKFLDDDYDKMYSSFERTNAITGLFAIMGIVISCIGLFGLASFIVENRTKEIGIRKVNGASLGSILGLLSKDFTMLVMIGFIIAAPVAWIILKDFMEMFAYRSPMAWWIFAGAGLLALLIAWLTISFHSIKAARRNPVEALRYE